MKDFADNDEQTITEAGRILIEAHEGWIAPKLDALHETGGTLAHEWPELEGMGSPESKLFIVPRNSESMLPFTTAPGSSDDLSIDEFMPTLKDLRAIWETEGHFSGYILPRNLESSRFRMILALRIGGWEQNQPFGGLLCMIWPSHGEDSVPLATPMPLDQLPGSDSFAFLPLPPNFGRTSEQNSLWLSLPAQIKHTPEWTDLETAVTILSETGAKILDRLVPILGDAAWKSMARRVMHELSRTVAMPQPMLEEARKALNSALSSVRRGNLSSGQAIEAKLIRHLKTIDDNLAELESDQGYVLSKVRWFFYLVAEELRADAPELTGIGEILQQSIESLGCSIESDAVLEDPESPLWRARLKLPRLFPQHSLEAFISNAFLRRDPSEPVRFSLCENPTGWALHWTNRADSTDAARLATEMGKPPAARSFGLRMADSISATFFGASLEIEWESQEESTLVHHRLPIPSSLLLLPDTAETNVSAS